MRVVAMMAVLMYGAFDAFFDVGVDLISGDETAEVEQVRSFDEGFPPPPSHP